MQRYLNALLRQTPIPLQGALHTEEAGSSVASGEGPYGGTYEGPQKERGPCSPHRRSAPPFCKRARTAVHSEPPLKADCSSSRGSGPEGCKWCIAEGSDLQAGSSDIHGAPLTVPSRRSRGKAETEETCSSRPQPLKQPMLQLQDQHMEPGSSAPCLCYCPRPPEAQVSSSTSTAQVEAALQTPQATAGGPAAVASGEIGGGSSCVDSSVCASGGGRARLSLQSQLEAAKAAAAASASAAGAAAPTGGEVPGMAEVCAVEGSPLPSPSESPRGFDPLPLDWRCDLISAGDQVCEIHAACRVARHFAGHVKFAKLLFLRDPLDPRFAAQTPMRFIAVRTLVLLVVLPVLYFCC